MSVVTAGIAVAEDSVEILVADLLEDLAADLRVDSAAALEGDLLEVVAP